MKQLVSKAFRSRRSSSQQSLRSTSLEPSSSPGVVARGEFVSTSGYSIASSSHGVDVSPSPSSPRQTKQQRRTTLPTASPTTRQLQEQTTKLFQSNSIEPVVSAPTVSSANGYASLKRSLSASRITRPTSSPTQLTHDTQVTPVFSKPNSELSSPTKVTASKTGLTNPFRLFSSAATRRATTAGETAAAALVDPPESISIETQPKRGDIVPLHYGTLDDQGMLKLNARSDHRPVVGSYAIYV